LQERIKALRKALGLTQKEFGAKLGVLDTAVTEWERGHNRVTLSKILLIESVFGVSQNWLKTGEGEMFN